MSWKKIFCGAVAASMIFSASVFAAPEDSANAKLAKIEIDTYGSEQSGAILDRISRLEENYSGEHLNGNMNARINAIYNVLYKNETEPSVLSKINALEWNIDHEVQSGGVDDRLTSLENKILGKNSDGTFNERIRALAKASFGTEILPITQIQISANTLIKVATTVPVGSKTLQEGDIIPIKVIEDVFVDDNLVFARGLTGEGVVVNVKRAKNIFSNGKIETDFNALKAIDGQDVQIFAGVEAVEAMTAEEMARGLSLLGQTFSGKNKNIEDVFVRGKNIDLPAGVELYVQIKTPIVVYGVNPNGGGNLVLPSSNEINTPPTTQQPAPVREETPIEPATPSEPVPGLTDDEMNAQPPANEPVIIDPEPTTSAPPQQTTEPRPDEGKTLDGKDGEIIEIFDEE